MNDTILSGGMIGLLTTVVVALILCGCAALIFWIVFGPDFDIGARGTRAAKRSGLYVEVMAFSFLAVLASSVLFFLSLRSAEHASQPTPPVATVVPLPSATDAANTRPIAPEAAGVPPAAETAPVRTAGRPQPVVQKPPTVAAEPTPAGSAAVAAPAPSPALAPPAAITEIAPAAGTAPAASSPPAAEPAPDTMPAASSVPASQPASPTREPIAAASAPVPAEASRTPPSPPPTPPAAGLPPSSAPSPPETASLPPPGRETSAPATNPEIDVLMQRGDALRRTGDVASARRFYERAAEQGSAVAARAVGETYDPLVLEDEHVRGVRADQRKAVDWYRKAILGGDATAVDRLHRLTAQTSG